MVPRVLVFALILASAGCADDEQPATDSRVAELEARLQALEEQVAGLKRRPAPAPTLPSLDAPRPSLPSKSRVTIKLTAGAMTIDGEAVATVALRAKLEAIAAASPDATITILADDDVPHARVMDTMDEVKKAGIEKIAMVNFSDDAP